MRYTGREEVGGVNEEVADIERGSRAFWSRMLRERFGSEIPFEIDWDSFEADSKSNGWVFYPLNIQQAGVERLIYALTGLMDEDEEFCWSAIDAIDSIHITSAAAIDAVSVLLHQRRLTYRCYAGDWDGYFPIEEIQRWLNGVVFRKSKARLRLEHWLKDLFGRREREAEPVLETPMAQPSESTAIPPAPEESAPVTKASIPDPGDTPTRSVPPHDPALAAELMSRYGAFLQALADRDMENLLGLVDITRTDEEVLRAEAEKDGFVSFSRWLLGTYPSREQASFVALKTKDEDLAACYLGWQPLYTREYLFLTMIRYLRIAGEWKVVFRLTEMSAAPFRVRMDEHPLDKALEVLDNNPLMALEHPEPAERPEETLGEPELTRMETVLKAELEGVLTSVFASLERRDLDGFLSAVVVSQEHRKKLRKKSRKLLREILDYTPAPSKATFVGLKTMKNGIAGYYFVAPYPANPAFRFVYLSPFVRQDGQWKLVFSLEHSAMMTLNAAKSGGDIVSRANEVIEDIPILHLDFVMTSLFEDALRDVR